MVNQEKEYVESLLARAERSLRPRRRFPIWLFLPAGILVVAAGLFAYYRLIPLNAPIPADVGAVYAGLEQGYTEQGFPTLGSPDAPILIEDFSSFACPHCRDFHTKRLPLLVDAIAAGEVRFVFIPVPHIGRGSDDAAKGALCAGEQDQFWEMSDVLFEWQDQFLTMTFAERRIQKGAQNMGLDTEAFDRCMTGSNTKTVLETARQTFDGRGLNGTPSFFINGERVRDYSEFDHLDELID